MSDAADRIKASLAKGVVKFGVVMDDKVFTIEMTWRKIRETGEIAMAEFILRQMREARDTKH